MSRTTIACPRGRAGVWNAQHNSRNTMVSRNHLTVCKGCIFLTLVSDKEIHIPWVVTQCRYNDSSNGRGVQWLVGTHTIIFSQWSLLHQTSKQGQRASHGHVTPDIIFPSKVLILNHSKAQSTLPSSRYASTLSLGMHPLMPMIIITGVSPTVHPALSSLHSTVPSELGSSRLRFLISHNSCSWRPMLWYVSGFGSAPSNAPDALCRSRAGKKSVS